MNNPGRVFSLNGRVAIVTGAGSRGEGIGNGRAIALVLARHGAHIALVDRDGAAAARTQEMICEAGGTSTLIVADVSSLEGCRHAVDATIEVFGRVDILVNNVGIIGPPGMAQDVDPVAWDLGFQVNVKSAMLMTKMALPHLRSAGSATIVNISSVVATRGGHPSLFYPASKCALIGMTRTMAAHHGQDGIRVNCVMPGSVCTPMVTSRGMSEETRARRRNSNLLKQEGTGWDVAYATLFLCSSEARWITGVVLPVDGGQSASIPIDTPDI